MHVYDLRDKKDPARRVTGSPGLLLGVILPLASRAFIIALQAGGATWENMRGQSRRQVQSDCNRFTASM